MGPELLPALLLSGGGTALQMMAQRDQADERRAVLNRQLERDKAATDRAAQMVQNEGQNFSAQARQQALADQEQRTFDQSQSDIQGAGAGVVNTAAGNGAVSDDFLRDKAQRQVDEGDRLTAVARAAAKSRAPTQLATTDALRRANLAGELQSLWGTTKNMGSANSLDAQSVEAPLYGTLGGIASSVGMSGLSTKLGKSLGDWWKYGGSSMDPRAPNYTNQMDLGAGIQF